MFFSQLFFVTRFLGCEAFCSPAVTLLINIILVLMLIIVDRETAIQFCTRVSAEKRIFMRIRGSKTSTNHTGIAVAPLLIIVSASM